MFVCVFEGTLFGRGGFVEKPKENQSYRETPYFDTHTHPCSYRNVEWDPKDCKGVGCHYGFPLKRHLLWGGRYFEDMLCLSREAAFTVAR